MRERSRDTIRRNAMPHSQAATSPSSEPPRVLPQRDERVLHDVETTSRSLQRRISLACNHAPCRSYSSRNAPSSPSATAATSCSLTMEVVRP